MSQSSDPAKPLSGKTALITGATRGLGYETSLALAEKGAHIIALGRTVGGLEELDDAVKQLGSKVTLVPLDLEEEDLIDALGPSLFPRFDKLDIFIGNAAYLGALSPVTHFKTSEWNKIFATNLTANYLLLRTLEPLLKRSGNATALFITDQMNEDKETAFWGPYLASKSALEQLAKSFATENADSTIKTQIYYPGPMATNLRRNAFPGEDQSNLTSPQTAAQKIADHLADNKHENGATINALT